jgi:hypothetical protein
MTLKLGVIANVMYATVVVLPTVRTLVGSMTVKESLKTFIQNITILHITIMKILIEGDEYG